MTAPVACACMGPIGDDPHCPCLMRINGLTPTPVWTPESKAQLMEAFKEIMRREEIMRAADKGDV